MLWHSLHDLRLFFDEFFISLLWSIFDMVKKQLLIGMETLYQFVLVEFPYFH